MDEWMDAQMDKSMDGWCQVEWIDEQTVRSIILNWINSLF